jgi:acyl-CoA synthetase (AMP-forming)/AMP-acid ligase II
MNTSARLKAEDHGPPTEDYSGSLWSLLHHSAQQYPHNTALICCQQSNDHLHWLSLSEDDYWETKTNLEWTYAHLLRAAETLGRSLQQAGLERASKLVVVCPNNAEWTILLWACASVGVTLVPLNPGLLGRVKEMEHVLETVRPNGIAAFDGSDIRKLVEKYSNLLDVRLKLFLGPKQEALSNDWVGLFDLVKNSSSQLGEIADDSMLELNTQRDSPSHDTAAIILFTSGTTSLPKAVPYTGKSLEAQSRPYWSLRRIHPESKVMPIGPGVRFASQTLAFHDKLIKVVPHPHRLDRSHELASKC